MKRSEMIKKLCEPMQIHDDNFRLFPSEAMAILERIEELGMMPPPSIQEIRGGYGINDATHVIQRNGNLVGACRVNRWEPENEAE